MFYRIGVVAFLGAALSGCSGSLHEPDAGAANVAGASSQSRDGSGAQPTAEAGAQSAGGSDVQPAGGSAGSYGGSEGNLGGALQPESESFPALWLTDVVEQAGTFVAVGSQGTGQRVANVASVEPTAMFEAIFTSKDGSNWQRVHSGTVGTLRAVVAGNGHFLTLIDSATPPYVTRTYTSADGVAWTPNEKPLPELRTVVFGNGVFVAAAAGRNEVYISTDAQTWDTVELPADTAQALGFGYLVFGAGHFVATHGSNVYASDDGEVWTLGDYDGPFISGLYPTTDGFLLESYEDCCFGEVPENIKFNVAKSSDGLLWQQRPLTGPDVFPVWKGADGCVELRLQPRQGTRLVGAPTCSDNAATISAHLSLAVRQAPQVLVSIADAELSDVLQTSSDGVTWTTSLKVE